MKYIVGNRLWRTILGITARIEPRWATVLASVDLRLMQKHADRMHSRCRKVLFTIHQHIGKQFALSGSQE